MSDNVELPLDIKTDLQIAFNLMKNENNKINRLKLRTLLFNFVMYKCSAYDINYYIEMMKGTEQENFTFDEVCFLVNEKLKESKERESDELFNYISKRKTESNKINKDDLIDMFNLYGVEIEDKELDKMINYMINDNKDIVNDDEENEDSKRNEDNKKGDKNKNKKLVTRSQFKKFYTNT